MVRRGARERPYQIELLCDHHQIDGFDCGHPELNDELRRRVSPFYDPDEGMVLAGVVDGVVVGYLVLVDVLFQLENEGKEERCFYLAYLGVDQSYRGSSLAGDLVRRAYEVRRQRRKRRKTYAAMIVNTYYNEELIDRVTGQRFKRLPGNSYLWYKRSG